VIIATKTLLLSVAMAGALLLSACEQAPQNTAKDPAGAAPAATGTEAPVSAAEPISQEDVAAFMAGVPRAIVSSDPLLNPDGLVDRPLGSPDAKVTLIEYTSPTCPYCARFHRDTYPGLIRDYVETGKVQFIVRPFARNILDSVVLMLAECSGTGYHDIISTFFATQGQWSSSETPRDAILAIAKQKGFTDASFEGCLADRTLFENIDSMRAQALEAFGLEGTPTFYLNGKKMSGNIPMDQLAAAIDPLL
jgi:protein-disulfide isomerase